MTHPRRRTRRERSGWQLYADVVSVLAALGYAAGVGDLISVASSGVHLIPGWLMFPVSIVLTFMIAPAKGDYKSMAKAPNWLLVPNAVHVVFFAIAAVWWRAAVLPAIALCFFGFALTIARYRRRSALRLPGAAARRPPSSWPDPGQSAARKLRKWGLSPAPPAPVIVVIPWL